MQTEIDCGAAGRIKPLWTTGGFHNPECGVVDHRVGRIYLSCMGSSGNTSAIGKGYIARLSMSGEVLEKEWIGGLKNPCGIAVRGTRLFVVDYDRLLVFDTRTARRTEEYIATDTKFLDGMAVDETGENVFVSDIKGNTIWRLEGHNWSCWLATPRLDFPDGMVAEPDRLVVGTHGLWKGTYDWQPGATQDHKGHLLAVDYETRTITDIGDASPIAHHDGITSDGADGYITSDYIYNTLIHVTKKGTVTPLYTFEPMAQDTRAISRPDRASFLAEYVNTRGPADLRYDAELGLLLVPFVSSGELAAFAYSPAS